MPPAGCVGSRCNHQDFVRNPTGSSRNSWQIIGDETGATQVLIAKDDARYSMFGTLGAVTGGFLKTTIGYGHRPLLAIVWMLLVVTIGCVMVFVGKRAGVMRPTWPENVAELIMVCADQLRDLPSIPLLARRLSAFRQLASGTLLVA